MSASIGNLAEWAVVSVAEGQSDASHYPVLVRRLKWRYEYELTAIEISGDE